MVRDDLRRRIELQQAVETAAVHQVDADDDCLDKADVDSGKRAGVPADVAERLKAVEGENRELRQANEILRKASAYFARLFAENFAGYGVCKLWRQLGREGKSVAGCTVERLMRCMGLQAGVRGKSVRTTIS